jgi:hypothetical protein
VLHNEEFRQCYNLVKMRSAESYDGLGIGLKHWNKICTDNFILETSNCINEHEVS